MLTKVSMSKDLYKLAWFLIPPIFFFVLLFGSGACVVWGCVDNEARGMVYAISAVIIYVVLVKGAQLAWTRHKGGKIAWHKECYFLIFLLVMLAYYLGKWQR